MRKVMIALLVLIVLAVLTPAYATHTPEHTPMQEWCEMHPYQCPTE